MTIRKRINREIEELEKYYDMNIEETNEFREVYMTICVLDYLVKITLNQYYPFKAPKALIDGVSYVNIYRNSYSKYQILYNKYGRHLRNCPCCYTMLCNWGPGNRIVHILKEIENWEKDKRRIETIAAYNIVCKQFPFDGLVYNHIVTYI